MAQGYTYNAIAEHPIIPEYDDNEIKYKWNGALLNLSDMSFEEYGKTIFNVTGSVTGETKVVTNSITLTFDDSGTEYAIVGTIEYPTDKQIVVSLSVEGESNPVVITIPANAANASASTSISTSESQPKITGAAVSPTKDDNYTYKVIIPEIITDKFTAYFGVCPESRIANIEADEVASMDMVMVTEEAIAINYLIPARDVKDPTEEELKAYRYGLVLALPKPVFDNTQYNIVGHTFHEDVTDMFVKQADIVIGTTQYTLLTWIPAPDEYIYTARYNEEIEYPFDIKYVK